MPPIRRHEKFGSEWRINNSDLFKLVESGFPLVI